MATPLGPVDVRPLFAPLDEALFALLRGLAPAQWQAPTIAGAWTVHDVVAHLLDTAVRRVSAQRDGHPMPPPVAPVASYETLVAHLNQLNHQWVDALRRVSPQVLLPWLEQAHAELRAFLAAQDPAAPAMWSVAWAGELESQNWFDMGRELTERWLHQQQIRQAVGAPDLFDAWVYRPVLDIFLRGLPYLYRDTAAVPGTAIVVRVADVPGADWCLVRTQERWQLVADVPAAPAAVVTVTADAAWRWLSKAWKQPEAIRPHLHVDGDAHLAEPLLHYAAVMA